ncbi:MAG: hypothetical protein ACJ72P_09800 [Nocardioides sp.]
MPTSRRLYVHIGLPKTGTSFLQAALLHNRAVLADQGLDLVPPTKRQAFELMLLVRDRYDPTLDSASVQDSLDRFPTLLERAPGSRALISQESLAAATPPQIRRLLDACGDREVHVVATVRDLARQLPSAWQQRLKSGGSMTYDEFLRRARALEQRGVDRFPWRHLNAAEMLTRWSEPVGPSRMHVVTLPPPGSPPTTLLERFCSVLDVDPDRMVPEETRVNTSLGRVQVELLRRVNGELPHELLPRQIYGGVGKRFFAAQVLAAQEARPIRVPAEFRAWCDEVAERQIKALEGAGYAVTGQLADLRGPDQAFADGDDEPTHRDVEEAAVKALAQILELRAQAKHRRARGRGARPAGGPAGASGRSLRARAGRLLRRLRSGTRG